MKIGRTAATAALLAIAVASAAAGPAVAQQARSAARAGSPRAVAERILASLARKDADAFTADVHPEALAAFRANVIRILEQSATPDQRAQGLQFFGGAKSIEELKKMPADRVFSSYMRGVFARMSARGPLQVTNSIVGEVPEGQSLVHVVYRARVTQGNESVVNVTLMSLRRTPGGWKAQLEGDLQGLAGPRGPAPR